MNTEHAVLTCSSCGLETDHELRYTGRLLHSTRCTSCDHVVRHDQRDLYTSYLRDLEHRVASKPRRLARAATREPWSFARGLPRAFLRPPGKKLEEFWTLWRR